MSYAIELECVIDTVKQSGALLLAEDVRPGGVRGVGSKAPVDEEIGRLICETLHSHFPNDSLQCEEGGGYIGSSLRAFVIDPNDGTRDFLLGHRENSVSVGMVDNGELVLGVVYAPFASELTGPDGLFVCWAKGEFLLWNGVELAGVSTESTLTSDSVLLVGRSVRGEILQNNLVMVEPAQIRHCSSIATRLALAAIGQASLGLTVRNPLSAWDFAGGQVLLQGAGGDLLGPSGQPIKWAGSLCSDEYLMGYFGSRSTALAQQVVERYKGITKDRY
ncbi:MAG TPA: hypothetical protein EYN66_12190 [Myxococcales bacterium]|nr:hypothetical protein [Myxococcales bacterium]